MDSTFNQLYGLNVNEKVEKKNGLSYLSWAWAWAETKRIHPNATYTIWKDSTGLPYVYDEHTGYMVYTTVTIEDVTHEMWLPVMDGANRAMKSTPYTITNRYGKSSTVEAATMFDINKTIMRCLTKNLAMFGLGLYIYAGEDLPETEKETTETTVEPLKSEQIPREELMQEAILKTKVIAYVNRHKFDNEKIGKLCKAYGVTKLSELTEQDCKKYIAALSHNGGDIDK